ncbi:GntR family transcriptional regulator [Mycobacterium sp. MBM]|nr:GntR family transcriptional regulator [Mycobacterium sp. MBM]
MPKRYGVKEKDLVITHVVTSILTGKLRSGDRLDRNEIAEDLGISRVPVQEAVVQLEHDGIVSTQYHRGAFLHRFDGSVLGEHYELYGVLNGIAAARAAADGETELHTTLRVLTAGLRSSRDTRGFHETAWQYRQAITEAHAGPRLQAAIGAAQTFIPRSFWSAHLDAPAELLEHYEAETAAITGRDPAAARAACAATAALMGRIMCGELVRRGVLEGPVAFETS